MELDHVLLAVEDLADAGRRLRERHGLDSIEGGRHAAWGTANRIVPLGDCYLELIAVVDARRAAASEFGRWVAACASTTLRPFAWAVRTPRLEEIAVRLGLTVGDGSRTTPDGQRLRWRSAGLERSAGEPSLPFFIEWEDLARHPGRVAVRHAAGNARIAQLVIDADRAHLAEWLGDHQLPVEVHEGKPAVRLIRIKTDAGETSIGAHGSESSAD